MVMTQRLSVEERMTQFNQLMRAHGYRPPTREDLIPGEEMLMVEVERFMESHNQGYNPSIMGTKIKLDEEPIVISNQNPTKEHVMYHCIMPAWDGQCFVPIESFLAVGYHKGCYENDTRWAIRAR
ncbi:MAG: hypothetical protein A3A96_00425 [Candidatus Zambryskibacteria bacterium RIFCSPLOWO2_01_FULL_39_39]|uniref:Uncharacterized protein n=1 Tax=Candidatus Zambryskibacteria bacterium RIFCSPLOWO2_01_FULL_39_39 TaxID=1802758 RepID=A0A1G2TX61_9BACT|nr:MAG: hypothetical protein A2644_01470 [Candidatus Zambryskibacteria bacterium RIFCSPHIGHO2_01_FULL_39_63]OHA94948.1 MAG: hypothetical protein A3B88_01045 [Candidatus Zambryskibacteria bacterium RIFCSPHIGHO2_02_FULL_39_19]OHA99129.1 MAG: hypothetical protein A3F20_02995 [Candidatus Zambryskibacteria bacterium RIFCSPHIGHO2_12_FULL_39_21]OHB01891.1 MAG: hypothetical protein A3A96_00425 [Candidatus Zambryskibacteria bacterium RIFCSPLOWO2_01_FULL_39_39]